MSYEFMLTERCGAVGIIKINSPKTLNALNTKVLNELKQAFTELADAQDVDVLLITGEGKAFVAGADISEMQSKNPVEAKAFSELGMDVFRTIEICPKPVIAAINGFALGGGCELAMACDLRVASQKAKLGQPEVGLGITPGFGGTQRLPRLVGESAAKLLIFTADIISADEALRLGLVDKVVAPEELMKEALALAEKIASKGQLAVRFSKEAIHRGLQADLQTGCGIERDLFALCFATQDQQEGMTAFVEKRPPVFTKQ